MPDAARRRECARPAVGTPASRPAVRATAASRSTRARSPTRSQIGLGERRFDVEGRLHRRPVRQASSVVNGYFPKGSGSKRDNSRVPYKLDFYAAVFARVQQLRRRGAGVRHRRLQHRARGDRPRAPEGKREVERLPARRARGARRAGSTPAGSTRSARRIRASAATTRGGGSGAARASSNVGWRIDYVFASPAAAKRVHDAFIWPEFSGSDHCPVGVDVA